MRILEGLGLATLPGANGRFASLHAHDLRGGFHAWYGASGRRYVTSVFAFERSARDAGLPAFEAFVLIAVARDGTRRFARSIVAIEWGSARHAAVATAIAEGVDEWHVHLLGSDRGAREAIAADLRQGANLTSAIARAG